MAPVQVNITGPRTPHSKQMEPPKDMDQNIQVFIRCRPLNEKYGEKKSVIELNTERREVRVNERQGGISGEKYGRNFYYDDVFDSHTSQLTVYRSVVEPLIDQVLAGYNCTVFAYGQTGTGKTYTMEGDRSDQDCSWEDDPRCGMVPRALHQLFESLTSDNTEYSVSVSFMELYNEELYDLLSPSEEIIKLKIYDDTAKKGKVIVGGLCEVNVNNKAEIYEILQKGTAKRHIAATKLNACSSRSHTIFAVTVRVKETAIDGEELLKIGKLNLVDLAGSENIGRSGAIEKRAREAGNINQSLLTLGRVITSLVEKAPHVPYRESKLTRLLRDSLGGGTKTSIIATVSPSMLDVEDTLSTLDYAQRAKKITNKPEVNQKMSKKTLLREYTTEIEKLRRELEASRGGSGAFFVNKENYDGLCVQNETQAKEIEEKEANLRALQEDLERLENLYSTTNAELEEKKEVLQQTTDTLQKTESTLAETKTVLAVVEKDCTEQKYLVDVHAKTEEKLSSQANQLLEVAHTTTDHVSKLHSKVDRQHSLEVNNFEKLDQFRGKFRKDMIKLEEIITKDANNDSLEELEGHVKNKFDCIIAAVQNIHEKVLAGSASWSELHNAFEEQNNSDKTIVDGLDILSQNTNGLSKLICENSCAVRGMFKENTTALALDIGEIVQLINTQRQEVEQMLMKQNQLIVESQRQRLVDFEEVKQSIKDTFDAEQAAIAEQKALVDDLESRCNKFSQSNNKKIVEFEALVCQQMKLMSQIKESNKIEMTGLTSSLDKFSTKLEQSSNSLVRRDQITSASIGKCEETCKASDDKAIAMVNEFDSLISKNIQSNFDQLTTAEKNSASREGNFVAQVSDKETTALNATQKMATLEAGLSDMVQSSLEERAIKLNMANSTISGNYAEVDAAQQEVTSIATEAADAVGKDFIYTKIAFKGAQKSMLKEASARVSDVEKLIKEQLARDTPTGQTPQKTAYNYPKDLVQTSPHDRILSRFRTAVDPTVATVVELPDFSDSDIASESFSSIESNTENKKPQSKNTSQTGLKHSDSMGSMNSVKSVSSASLKNGKGGEKKAIAKPKQAFKVKANN